jgi:23S rRNA (guanosine2251-2'-O)-methyltransferase
MRKLSIDELNRISADDYQKAEKTNLIIVLDNVRSQHNIGSIFRTCDAFRVAKIFLCGITATPPNQEIHKTALGAEETVMWEYAEDTLVVVARLKGDGYTILSAEQTNNSVLLQDYPITADGKYALVLGHEFKGVEQSVIDASDACIEIPQFGTKHSLNVAVSGGILIWHFYRYLKML